MQSQVAFYVDWLENDDRFDVYIHHDKMGQFMLKEGQPIKIISQTNQKSVCAKVFSAKGECPLTSIKMGFALRRNICVYLGQTVSIQPLAELKTAEIVTISCVNETIEGIDGSLIDILFASRFI